MLPYFISYQKVQRTNSLQCKIQQFFFLLNLRFSVVGTKITIH